MDCDENSQHNPHSTNPIASNVLSNALEWAEQHPMKTMAGVATVAAVAAAGVKAVKTGKQLLSVVVKRLLP